MTAGTYDLSVDQGADWFWTITWKVGSTARSSTPKNTTGFTARMQVRAKYDSPTAVVSLNSVGSQGLTVSSNGIFSLHLTAAQTSNIPSGKYIYDVEAISPTGVVTKLARGAFRVIPEVTR